MEVIPSEVSNAYLSLMSPAKEEQLMIGRFDGRFRSSTSKLDPRLSDPTDERSYISHDSYFEVKLELKTKIATQL